MSSSRESSSSSGNDSDEYSIRSESCTSVDSFENYSCGYVGEPEYNDEELKSVKFLSAEEAAKI